MPKPFEILRKYPVHDSIVELLQENERLRAFIAYLGSRRICEKDIWSVYEKFVNEQGDSSMTAILRPTQAQIEADDDARLFGTGFIKIFPDGRQERIDPRTIFLIKPTQAQIDAALDAYAAKLTQIFDEFKELQPAHRRVAMIAALIAAAEVGEPDHAAEASAYLRNKARKHEIAAIRALAMTEGEDNTK